MNADLMASHAEDRWSMLGQMLGAAAAVAVTVLPLRRLFEGLAGEPRPAAGLSPGVARMATLVIGRLAEVAVLLLALWLFYRFTRRGSLSELGLSTRKAAWLVPGLLLPPLGLAAVLTVGLLARLLPVRDLIYPGPWPVLLATAAATSAAWTEEVLYRGIFLSGTERLWNRPIAVAVSTVLFATMHLAAPFRLPPTWWVLVVLGGAGLAWSYYTSGRALWLPIGLHWSFTAAAYLAFGLPGQTRGALLWTVTVPAAALTPAAGLTLLGAALCTGLALAWTLARRRPVPSL